MQNYSSISIVNIIFASKQFDVKKYFLKYPRTFFNCHWFNGL